MGIPRRLINILGLLVVFAVLVVGTVLGALPLYLESLNVRVERATVAMSNDQLASQIDALRVQRDELPEIEADLDALRAQLPAAAQLNDASALVVRAARAAQVAVVSIDYGEAELFSAPGVEPDANANAAPLADPETAAATPDEPLAADEDGAMSEPGERLQVPVTISVTAESIARIPRLLDELRKGARLLRVTSTSVTHSGEPSAKQPVAATITGLAFARLDE